MALIDARDIVTQPNGWTDCNPIGHAIHHSVTFISALNPTIEDERNHIRMIDIYHVSQDFGGFGYHTATFASGHSYLTGNWNRARAHVKYRNHELVGSVAIGNFSLTTAPPAIIAGLAECVAEARRVFGRVLPVNGHGQWADPRSPSSCPGLIRTQIAAIIAALAQEDDMDANQAKQLGDIWNVLFNEIPDPRYADGRKIPRWAAFEVAFWVLCGKDGGTERWAYWTQMMAQIRAMLFDDLTTDAATDKRRLIGIGNMVKNIAAPTAPTLSAADIDAIAVAVANKLDVKID